MQKKLTKNVVIETDIEESVKSLIDPTTPLALRLSGQLLLGLVRIYSKKARYLQDDCSSAMANIKVVFSRGNVDLAPESGKATEAQINLPNNFDDLDFDMDDYTLEELQEDFDMSMDNVARADDITQESRFMLRRKSRGGESDSDVEQPRNGDTKSAINFDINIEGDGGDLLNFDDQPNVSIDGQSSMLDFDDGLAGDLSTVNNTVMGGDGQPEPVLDEKFLDEDLIAPATPARKGKSKSRKRARVVRDMEIEVSSKHMSKQIKDTSAITCERPLIEAVANPKRARAASKMLASEPLSLYLGDSMAPSLLKDFAELIKKSVKETKKEKVLAEDNIEERGPNDIDFDMGDNFEGQSMNDVSTIGGGLDMTFDLDEQGGDSGFTDMKHQDTEHDTLDDDEEVETASEGKGREKKADRLVKMYHFLKNNMGKRKDTTFEHLLQGASRKAAAGVFHELLVMKTRSMIEVEQAEAYGSITITKTKLFNKGLAVSAH